MVRSQANFRPKLRILVYNLQKKAKKIFLQGGTCQKNIPKTGKNGKKLI